MTQPVGATRPLDQAPPPPPPPPPKPDPVAQPHHAKTNRWGEDFKHADRNHDGKLSRSEIKLVDKRLHVKDTNHDGKLTFQDYNRARHQANSFETLDHNHDGVLDDQEAAKAETYLDDAFGADRAGGITRAEFVKDTRADRQENEKAKAAEDVKHLGHKERAKLEKKYDANHDGQLDAGEFLQSVVDTHKAKRDKLTDEVFDAAAGDKKAKALTGKAAKAYADYDADGDGKVTRDEFRDGRNQDLHAITDQKILGGQVDDKALMKRAQVDDIGHATPISAGGGEGFGKDVLAAAKKLKANGYRYTDGLEGASFNPVRFKRGCCADYVADAYAKAGKDLYKEMKAKGYNPHYAPSMMDYFKAHEQKLSHNAHARVGDAVFFDWNGNGSPDHVGIVSAVDHQGRPTRVIESYHAGAPVAERSAVAKRGNILGYGRAK